jgi:predicted Zn-dependent peptidase
MGSKTDIFSVTLDDCRTLLTETILPSLKIIAITGNFSHSHIELSAKKLSECCKRKESEIETIFPDSIKSLVLAPRPNATQSVLRLGKITLPKNHIDYPVIQVANTILGGFFMSRINSVLREDKGLTYGAGSMIESYKHFSVMTAYSSLNSEGIVDSINFLNELYNTLPDNPITEEELQRSTRFMYGSFIRGMETPSLIANMIHSILSDELPIDFYNHFYACIIELTPDEVTQKAHEYLSCERFTIAVCSDEKTLRSKFDYHETLIYDAAAEMS